jgi:hypothetical protein
MREQFRRRKEREEEKTKNNIGAFTIIPIQITFESL